jgi:hypothetical protein
MKVNVAALSELLCELSGPQAFPLAKRTLPAWNNTGGKRRPNHSLHSTDVTEQATRVL